MTAQISVNHYNMKTSGPFNIQDPHVRSFLRQAISFVDGHQLLPKSHDLLLSVSGGPDSMALLALAFELKRKRSNLDVKVLYVDHQTRPEQAQERDFVAHWAHQFGFSFVSERLESWEGQTQNFEARSRQQRKRWASEHARGRVIFTGHHLDDSFEWFLMQTARSTQLRPRGIPLVNGLYRRPWLCVQKKQILRFLHAYGLPYMRDPSNRDSSLFERNHVRHHVLSSLKQLYPKTLKNYAHRQNALALADGVHRLQASLADVVYWKRGVSLMSENWEPRHDPLRVEQLKEVVSKQSEGQRSELCWELYKVLKGLRSGAKGPHKVSRSVNLFLWGREIFVICEEDLSFYREVDEHLKQTWTKGAQIPKGLPLKVLPSGKKSLKAAHPLFPKFCQRLKDNKYGWQTPGR